MQGSDSGGGESMANADIAKTPTDELLQKLESSSKGLTSAEASTRLEKYGYNEITEKKKNPILKFLRYFWGPIPWMIEVAVVLSGVIGHYEDLAVILALLLTNAFVGFFQERKAENAVELLKQRLAPEARVKRDGEFKSIPARELVPGDVVRVRLGDIVPADLKLLSGEYLEVDQSALTGESLPVEKAVDEAAFSGSVVRKGEMDGLVVSTAMHTYFGRTTELVEEARTVSHFQRNVVKIANYLIIVDVILVSIVIAFAILRGEDLLITLQFALVLTIAAIPVALPAVLSVAMAIGAIALAKKEAIVSRLVSIEEMAGMDILCCDKTGTITKNQLSVAKVIPLGDETEASVMLAAALASRAEDKDPIDNAVLEKANATEGAGDKASEYKVNKFTPFDPTIKRTEAEVSGEGGQMHVAKGAPQVILELAADKSKLESKVNKEVDEMAGLGYRALGVGRKENGDWVLIGLLGLEDPPREDSAETIKGAKRMGVEVKMVTGDHTAIAKQISQEIGLGTEIVRAEEFFEKPDDAAADVVDKAEGFAEVFPEHKYRIVELLQKKGHIVGMTGDGVNDAPALKKADTGIAVEGATDAAKAAADIVLTRPGLSVIIDAIVESRKIFQRMINYSIYRISETVRVLFFISLSILIYQFYPITALMIVLLALLNDLPIMTIAYDNVRFSAKPEKWDLRIIILVATIVGFIGVVESFIVLSIGLNVFNLSLVALQSFIYLKLSVGGHLVLLVVRTKAHFWTVRPAWPLLLAVILTQTTATILVLFGILLPQLDAVYVLFIWLEGLVVFVLTDYFKVWLYKVLFKRGLAAPGIASLKEIPQKTN